MSKEPAFCEERQVSMNPSTHAWYAGVVVRIVAVADTHTFQADFTDVPEGDVFIHAGDMCRGGTLEASGVTIDPDSRRATVGGEQIELTAKEFDLLSYLVSNSGRVISRDEILEAVWGGQHSTDSNVIEVFVCHLRNKIGDRDNTIIQTIRGVGYFFARG